MKIFSVTFRDKSTGKLYGGIVNQEELTKLVNNDTIVVCVTREVEVEK